MDSMGESLVLGCARLPPMVQHSLLVGCPRTRHLLLLPKLLSPRLFSSLQPRLLPLLMLGMVSLPSLLLLALLSTAVVLELFALAIQWGLVGHPFNVASHPVIWAGGLVVVWAYLCSASACMPW